MRRAKNHKRKNFSQGTRLKNEPIIAYSFPLAEFNRITIRVLEIPNIPPRIGVEPDRDALFPKGLHRLWHILNVQTDDTFLQAFGMGPFFDEQITAAEIKNGQIRLFLV